MATAEEGAITEGALEGVERRRNRWLLGLAMMPIACAALLMIASSLLRLDVAATGCITLLTTLLGVATTYFVWLRDPWPRRVSVRLEAGSDQLTNRDGATDRARSIATARMLRGVRTAGPRCQLVRITRRWGSDLVLELGHPDADTLLSRLGLDVRQKTATFRGMSRMHAAAWTMGTAGAIAVLSSMAIALAALKTTPALLVLIPIVLLAPVALALIPSRVDVGADGVLLRWAGTKRFIRHADLAGSMAIAPRSSNLTIVSLATRDGTTVEIPIAGQGQWSGDADELCARILDARRAWTAGEARAPMPLLRGERDFRAWVSALRRQDAADLRSAALPRAELWRVIEDPSGPQLERAAAALALGRDLGDVDRARLARVANATAAPKLRVLLERAEIAEDEELAGRLRTLQPNR